MRVTMINLHQRNSFKNNNSFYNLNSKNQLCNKKTQAIYIMLTKSASHIDNYIAINHIQILQSFFTKQILMQI